MKTAPFDVQAMVTFFQGFQQQLMNCVAKNDQAGVAPLAEYTQNEVKPKINEVMFSNTALSGMGPLNTERTIKPEQALDQNAIFNQFQQASMNLVAIGQAAKQKATATVAILSITYTSRHGGENKLLRPDGRAGDLLAGG